MLINYINLKTQYIIIPILLVIILNIKVVAKDFTDISKK